MDARLKKLKQVLESAVEGLSHERLLWHPEGKWCAAEVLERLYLTYTGTIKGFQKALVAGQSLNSWPSLKQRWQILVLVGFNYLPAGRKSPAIAQPKGLPLETVREDVGRKIAEMDAIIGECEARFGGRIPLLNHPILGPLTGKQWKKFH